MSDFGSFVQSVPFFTRYWLGGTILLSLLGRIGLVSSYRFVLLYEPLVQSFQIWRPITALFFYPINPATGFHFLINCYFLYNYSSRLETGHFDGRPADYLFMLLVNWFLCVLIGLFTNLYYLMDPMVLSVLYVWCQLNKDLIVNFWFGSRFKAMYLPWVLLAFNMIVSGGGLMELVGIIVGHCYTFFTITYPQEMGGDRFLSTPSILYNIFPNRQSNVHGFGATPWRNPTPAAAAAPSANAGSARRHDWGSGHTLGNR